MNVFAAQFYSLISIENYADLIEDSNHKAIFADPNKLLEIKKSFVRFASEEHLRRIQQNPEKLLDNLVSILYPTHIKDFIDPIWARRK